MKKIQDDGTGGMYLSGDMHLERALEHSTFVRLSDYMKEYYTGVGCGECVSMFSYVAKRKGNVMPFSIPLKDCPASDVFLFMSGLLRVLSDDGYEPKGTLRLHDRDERTMGLIYIEGSGFTIDTCISRNAIFRATVQNDDGIG